MKTFSNIKELVSALNREHKLLTEMFKKRKSASYKYEYALKIVDNDDNRIQYLITQRYSVEYTKILSQQLEIRV